MTDPTVLELAVKRHLAWLEARGYAAATVEGRRRYLRELARWCSERSVERPDQLNREVLDAYQRWLSRRLKPDGTRLSRASQGVMLSAVTGFGRWLARERLVVANPAAELELPKRPSRLPKAVLTAAEAEQVLAVPDVTTLLGLRNRAILETLYATGVRRSELVGLDVGHVDLGRGVLAVRQGKGAKDRFVPLSERVAAWLRRYTADVRPHHQRRTTGDALFLSVRGARLSHNHLGEVVRAAVEASGVGKSGACHLFRHTLATLMLEGGADTRYIQQMLGHAKLDTTQVYTQVSVSMLRTVYEGSHPGARLRRRGDDDPAEQGQRKGPRILLDEEIP
jgi:integrase/recombinase XerD